MSVSNLRPWLVRLALIVAALLALAPVDAWAKPPVRRPTAPEILAETITRIGESTTKAQDRIEVLADRAIFRLERSARNGASDASLEKAASKAKKGLPGQARGAQAQINREVGRGMIRMRSAEEYTNDLQEDLFFERETAIAELQDAVEEGEARIDEAVAELLGEAAGS